MDFAIQERAINGYVAFMIDGESTQALQNNVEQLLHGRFTLFVKHLRDRAQRCGAVVTHDGGKEVGDLDHHPGSFGQRAQHRFARRPGNRGVVEQVAELARFFESFSDAREKPVDSFGGILIGKGFQQRSGVPTCELAVFHGWGAPSTN